MVTYEFTATVFKWHGTSAWHFVPLPSDLGEEITRIGGALKSGWGSIKVTATVGSTTWSTSIFPDKQRGTYLLPVKAEVRRAEGIGDGDEVNVSLSL